MKKLHFYVLMLFNLFISCDENKESSSVAQQLQGDWDVTSFTIDGTEILASSPTSELDFGKYDGAEGEFEFVFVDNNNITSRSNGTYELNDAQNQIELNYNNGAKYEYAIIINQNKLTMEADITGTSSFPGGNRTARHIIKADKE